VNIPIELIDQIERGNCVLFIGWADSKRGFDESYKLTEQVIAQRLAERVHYPNFEGMLYEVAEYFEVKQGRHALLQYVCDIIEEYANYPPDYYESLVELPFNIIVSTRLDNTLKRTLRKKGRRFVSVVGDEEISFIDDDKLLVVKLHGDVDNKSSIVLTREDYIVFFDKFPNISHLIKYYFSTKTLLFLGYDLNDPHFLQLYSHTNQRTRYQRRSYFVKQNPSDYEVRLWQSRNLTILNTSANDFLNELSDNVSIELIPPKDIITKSVVPRKQLHIPKSPYKFLSSYDEQDVDIFFGRDKDTSRILQKLLSSKLMILYGKSGFGKTSLLNAGITPKLIFGGYLPVYARCASDPLESIKLNIIDRLQQLNGTAQTINYLRGVVTHSLSDFIRELNVVDKRSLVVFIDQFEEFFISLGSSTRKQFEQEIAECIESPYIDATFLLSLREDFLAELDELRRLRNIFANRYRLKALPKSSAKSAILRPAEKFEITFDNGLVDQIIQELLEKEQVDPAQLQIVCDSLYNSLPDKERHISHILYNNLGGVKKILADYVDDILDSFGTKKKLIARQLLRSMVTSLFTKTTLTYTDAILETSNIPDWNAQDTDSLLTDLVQVRLIRRIANTEEESYELTHEHLINKIREWIDLEMLKVKEAQDLLRQEYNNWRRHKMPMGKSALRIIDAQRDKLALNKKVTAFILAAAINYDFEITYWLKRNHENQQATEQLVWLLDNGTPNTQRLAGIAIGHLSNKLTLLSKIYEVYESVANPNTIHRIREMQSLGFCFGEGFFEKTYQVVEQRFTKNMVFVEAGDFLMGTSEEEVDELVHTYDIPPTFFEGQYPVKTVRVEDFYIDRFLVTNTEFKEFKPSHTFPEGHEDHPATHVSWYEAQEYAEWIGKTLPTEEEWEKAARGINGRRFPWGEEWDPTKCNTRLSGYGGTTPVNQFPSGKSLYGCYDLSGNVWEWTSTWLNAERKQKILKGGSWSKYGILPWCWYRFNYEPDSGYSNVGFRCIQRKKRDKKS
jgi:formylglycine-generating enzyme required for sulfatase activity